MKIFGKHEQSKIKADWDDQQTTGIQEAAPQVVETTTQTPEAGRVAPNFAATAGNLAVHGTFNPETPTHDVQPADSELVGADSGK